MSLSLAPFLSGGLFPFQTTALQAHPMADAASNGELTSMLRQGAIGYRTEDVSGWKMPRLLTIWSVPASVNAAADAMRDVGRWSEWMPRFSTSEKLSSRRPGTYFQEARMKAAGLKIHYRVEVAERGLEAGLQLYWSLEETGFRKDRLGLGLALNNGSFALYPITEEESFVAYSIHTQVSPLMPGTAGKITSTTIKEFPDFPSALSKRVSGSAPAYRMVQG